MKTTPSLRLRSFANLSRAAVIALASLGSASLYGQTIGDFVDNFNSDIGTRIEAQTVLGADYGLSGGTFNFWGNPNADGDVSLLKIGGLGDIGADDPKQIGDSSVRWSPRLLGSFGYMKNERKYHSGILAADESTTKSYGILLGGGGRFWFTEHLSLAPTISGMYSYAENDYDANNSFSRTNYSLADRLGLINYTANFWAIRPGIELEYTFNWGRTLFTLSSDYAFIHTESFSSTSDLLDVNGDSHTWKNMVDADIPLGIKLFGRELRTGGFFSWTEFFGDLSDDLGDWMCETHGRLVLDMNGKFWKLKWIGIGGSWMQADSFNGWSVGAAIDFEF